MIANVRPTIAARPAVAAKAQPAVKAAVAKAEPAPVKAKSDAKGVVTWKSGAGFPTQLWNRP